MRKINPHSRGLIWRFFREQVRPYIGLQLEIGFCLLISVTLEMIDPLILKAIIDRALGDNDSSLLVILVSLLLGVLIFRIAFRLVTVWLYSYSGLRILFDFRQRVFEHVEQLTPFFFRRERTGDILSRMTSDIDVLQRAAAHTVIKAVQDLLTLFAIVGVLLWLDVTLTLVLIAVYPFLVVVLARINRRLRTESMRAREAIGDLYSFLEERLSCIRLIQEFLRQKAEARGHVRVSRPWIRSNLSLSMIGAGQVSLADLMATSAFILVFLIGGDRVLGGSLSLGSLVAFYTLATRLHRPISGLIDINIDIQMARASLGRVYDLLDTLPDVRESPEPRTPAVLRGAMELNRVSLTWPDGTRALQDVDIKVEPGQVAALVGPSGSGKSTLAALMARYLDPQRGSIQVDGVDLRQWPLKALHRQVSLIPQETQLFHDTLAANLRLARPGASDGELAEALVAVELGEFLAALPEGLMTVVGEQGLRLSGGERQRIALARGLLKTPTVHILDEATSALDPRTERRVMEQYLDRSGGRTLIIIAHRLTSITHADRIFVLHEGKLVESGKHDELYKAEGLYRILFDNQSREGAA
ncbi:MAG: ABC transporter ATP-binding protein [Planctomycetota bacterium]